MVDDSTKSEFWKNVLRAVEADPRPALSIRGASGFSHPVVSVGVDEKRRRVVVISGESDARSAALAHGDIQAAMPSLKVMMARPAVINLGEAARVFTEILGTVSIGAKELQWFSENQDTIKEQIQPIGLKIFGGVRDFTVNPFSIATVNLIAVWKDIIQQLSLIEMETKPQENHPQESTNQSTTPTFHFNKLIALDPAETDRRLGVCSIPLYGFSPEDVNKLQTGRDIEAVRDVLRRYDILQYFFPPADQLTLGIAEQISSSPVDIVDRLIRTPEVGHPFGQLEIVGSDVKPIDMIAALKEQGFLVEGEVGMEITDKGKSVRAQVRFKPREGIFARLANIFSVKVDLNLKDLKDLFKNL